MRGLRAPIEVCNAIIAALYFLDDFGELIVPLPAGGDITSDWPASAAVACATCRMLMAVLACCLADESSLVFDDDIIKD